MESRQNPADPNGKPLDAGPLPEGSEMAFAAWNIMKGIDWTAIDIVCAKLGIDDPDLLIDQLLIIREFYGGRH